MCGCVFFPLRLYADTVVAKLATDRVRKFFTTCGPKVRHCRRRRRRTRAPKYFFVDNDSNIFCSARGATAAAAADFCANLGDFRYVRVDDIRRGCAASSVCVCVRARAFTDRNGRSRRKRPRRRSRRWSRCRSGFPRVRPHRLWLAAIRMQERRRRRRRWSAHTATVL